MHNISGIQAVNNFIDDHKLKDADSIIAFNAKLVFDNKGVWGTLISEVQVISVPGAMMVYIFEFNDSYQLPGIYSTDNFYFTYVKNGELRISDKENNSSYIVSIQPQND